jgi:hypothetical protein
MSFCEKCGATDRLSLGAIGGSGDVVLCDNCVVEQKLQTYKTTQKGPAIRPAYYSKYKMDIIEFCQINNLDFMVGNVIKYVMRHKDKNGLEDIRKAMTYLKRIAKHDYNEDIS